MVALQGRKYSISPYFPSFDLGWWESKLFKYIKELGSLVRLKWMHNGFDNKD